MSLTREYVRRVKDYIDYKLDAPRRLLLGGTTGSGGGSGQPPGGVTGQLAQRYICYDTSEDWSSGSTPDPSLVHNLNRIRGGHAIADDAILNRHMLWSTGCLAGDSGSICAFYVPFFTTSGNIPSDNVRDAIEDVEQDVVDLSDRVDDLEDQIDEIVGDIEDYYLWHTFMFSMEGTLSTSTGKLRIYAPGDMTMTEVFVSVDTPPDGGSIIVDINKNGSTIFTDQSNRPQITSGSSTGYGTPDVTALAKGDYLTMDVDQTGTTVPGANLVAEVWCKQYLQSD